MRYIDAAPRIGSVKRYSPASGYGFLIDHLTGAEVFMHATGLVDPRNTPIKGTRVQFVIVNPGGGKPRAVRVRSLANG